MSKLKKTLANSTGTATIYLIIIFMAMLVFIGLFVDLARVKVAQNQLRRAVNASARAVLANYDPALKNQFGIFTVNNPQKSSDIFEAYIKVNFASSRGQNFDLLDYRYEGSSFTPGSPIEETENLRRQILEDVKYKAPLEYITLFDKMRSVFKLKIRDEQNRREELIAEANSYVETVGQINKKIKIKKEDIKKRNESLKITKEKLRRENAKKRPTKRVISRLKRKKQRLEQQLDHDRQEISRLLRESVNKRTAVEQQFTQLDPVLHENRQINGLLSALEDINSEVQGSFSALGPLAPDQLSEAQLAEIGKDYAAIATARVTNWPLGESGILYEKRAALSKVFEITNDKNLLVRIRDQLWINEYPLQYFTCLTNNTFQGSPDYVYKHSEIEYVLYGPDPETKAISAIFGLRSALNTVGNFLYTPGAASQAKLLSSMAKGGVQGAIDTCKLLRGEVVSVVEISPAHENPLRQVQVNYKDHLRLLLLEDDDEITKLQRIKHIISARSGKNPAHCFTLGDGSAEISIKLWFLPLGGFDDSQKGPFNTEIRTAGVT